MGMALRSLVDQGLVVIVKTRGADHHRPALLATVANVVDGGGGIGELDQNVEWCRADVVRHRHRDGADTRQCAGIGCDHVAAATLDGMGDAQFGLGLARSNNRAPHPATRAGNCHINHRTFPFDSQGLRSRAQHTR
jgi:hypothetical protein